MRRLLRQREVNQSFVGAKTLSVEPEGFEAKV